MSKEDRCPHCGYCPHCGRSNTPNPYQNWPIYPYTNPYPITVWNDAMGSQNSQPGTVLTFNG